MFHIFKVDSCKTTSFHHKRARPHASPRLTLSRVNSPLSLAFARLNETARVLVYRRITYARNRRFKSHMQTSITPLFLRFPTRDEEQADRPFYMLTILQIMKSSSRARLFPVCVHMACGSLSKLRPQGQSLEANQEAA